MADTTQNTLASWQPALPKAGGAIQGAGAGVTAGGPRGMAGFSIPLPLSAGRGGIPALSLDYSGSGGNGYFGLGGSLSLPAIRRDTRLGAPAWTVNDRLREPDGDLLVPALDSTGKRVSARQKSPLGVDGYQVTRYRSERDDGVTCTEWWQKDDDDPGFWRIRDASGSQHWLGVNAGGQLAGGAGQVAEWWLQASLSADGQAVCYDYRTLRGADTAFPQATGIILSRVFYGNAQPVSAQTLWAALAQPGGGAVSWLFALAFDDAKADDSEATPPAWLSSVIPSTINRPDAFSRFDYGFEVRIPVLCHQIVMFHRLKEGDTLSATGEFLAVKRVTLEYEESPVATCLSGFRVRGFGVGDIPSASLPPVDVAWTPAALPAQARTAQGWTPFPALAPLQPTQQWQLVDLYGEGLAGILFRDTGGWYYRAPVRGMAGTDEVTYGKPVLLPAQPSLSSTIMMLADPDNDGRTSWIQPAPGMAGRFVMKADGSWSGFVPHTAWPSEYLHNQALMADLTGDGRADLMLLGPGSLRLYVNQGGGAFAPGITTTQAEGTALPVAGRNATELVAFSDMAGSGQQHLVSVRHDRVVFWPNLGRGMFGAPRALVVHDGSSFSQDAAAFNPQQVLLADTDGSGTTDVIYVEADGVRLFINQAGNGFAPAIHLPFPEGGRYDRLCSLSLADTDGRGVPSLILTCPHMQTQHWRHPLVPEKSGLPARLNNNTGTDIRFIWRSSARYWLDEKQENPGAVSRLPFPLMVLAEMQTQDEVTENTLVQRMQYRRGVYDAALRDFTGFGLTESCNSGPAASGTLSLSGRDVSPGRVVRTWYHTGRPEDSVTLPDIPGVKKLSVIPGDALMTRYDKATGKDRPLTPEEATDSAALHRALRGSVRGEAIYADGAGDGQAPFSATLYRHRVRLVQPAQGSLPVVAQLLPGSTTDYQFERQDNDPQISQALVAEQDEYGFPVLSFTVNYPRRPLTERGESAARPYLPEGKTTADFEDEQQQILRLTALRQAWHHLTDPVTPDAWRPGLPQQQRADMAEVTGSGALTFSADSLQRVQDALPAGYTWQLAGQQRLIPAPDVPPELGLLSHTEEAVLDKAAAETLQAVTTDSVDTLLPLAGWKKTALLFGQAAEKDTVVWYRESGLVTYGDSAHFFLPVKVRQSFLTGETLLVRDENNLFVTQVTGPDGTSVRTEYSGRLLQPRRTTDTNGNIQEVVTDALGQVRATRFYGQDAGKPAGFIPASGWKMPEGPPGDLLPLAASRGPDNPLRCVSGFYGTDIFSWMGKPALTEPDKRELIKRHLITPEGNLRAAGRRMTEADLAGTVSAGVLKTLTSTLRAPVSSAIFTPDRYPDDPAQQVRVSISSVDGFGRVLQTAVRHAPGPAWPRTADNVPDTRADNVVVESRWVISGLNVHDGLGQVVRTCHPYFADGWQPFSPVTAAMLPGVTTDYDALGRVVAQQDDTGAVSRVHYHPWFTVTEDANDTHDASGEK